MAKNVKRESKFATLMEDLATPTTDVYTNDDTQAVVKRERKTKRIQLLTYESLIDQVDAYATARDLSRAEVIEMALREFFKNER
jgi:hypothetical protein